MKKISDYKGEDALELWGDLLDPMITIMADPDIASTIRAGKAPLIIAKEVIRTHKKEALEIMRRIDPTPVDGINFATRIVDIVMDFMRNDAIKDFFASAGQDAMENEFTGSATENTGAEEA